MGAQFDGAGSNTRPDVYVDVTTIATGVSSAGGNQQPILMGEGSRFERLVPRASGSGRDGWNDTFTSTLSGTDGRHFKTSLAPIQSNRYTVFKNGIPLVGLEQDFDSDSGSFSNKYDYRINIDEGWIQLQAAALLDQGGAYFTKGTLNVGTGTINTLTLEDENAPTETWTIRCTSVIRDGYGDPISGLARFIAQGSVSGVLLDGYGNVVTWQSDDIVVSNDILSFSIAEGGTAFQEGDKFTVKVKGGTLVKGDSLSVDYIAVADINDPEFWDNLDKLQSKHGAAALDHPLSLGAQIAFANVPPGVWAIQTAPAVPRRVSYDVETSASGQALIDDLTFVLPFGVEPDFDSKINFFITDPVTAIETQIIPNKVDFYDPTYTASPAAFCFSGSLSYSYTVVLEDATIKDGDDGVVTSIGPSSATVSSEITPFDSGDVGKTLKILTPATNAGTYTIVSVALGVATISGSSFTDEEDAEFQVIDDTSTSAKILMTDDLALSAGQSLRVTVVDTKDADFFDAGWTAALEIMERINVDIVVPLPTQTISAIFQNCLAHCEAMSAIKAKRERRLYIGAIRGLTPDNLLGNEDAAVEDIGILEGIQGDDVSEILASNTEDLTNYSVADAFGGSFRCVYYYPDEIVVQIGADRSRIDGFYIAAAGAGFVASLANPVVPQTNKVLRGFTILRDKLLSNSVIEALLGAGIAVVQPVTGGGEVVWGKTTTQSGNAEEEEDSIVAIRDIIAKAARRTMKPFIGLPPDAGTQGTLMGKFDNFLKGLVSSGFISAFKDVRVSNNAIEPRQWDFTASVRPRYPINWEYIKINIGNI
jgi:hypothetical protein